MVKKFKAKMLDQPATVLAVIGAINWGFEVLNYNLVKVISSLVNMPGLIDIIYTVIGVSGVWVAGRSLEGKFMK